MVPPLDLRIRIKNVVTDVTQIGKVQSAGSYFTLVVKESVCGGKTGQTRQYVNLPIAISPITYAFALRRCAVA